ncbi:MAG: threonine synthase [Aigarchaeota archaeon]|nr:threonine synthase [Candidatus Pelearchaeum maunauluense]
MSYVVSLVCSRCGRRYEPRQNPLMCEERDFGRLDINYDYVKIMEKLDRDKIAGRPQIGVWRYAELMPADKRFAAQLNEGNTPLIRSKRLAGLLGMKNLYLKDETRNPTASFKDRAMAVGAAKAAEMGKSNVVIASSGNAASSLAAYSAALGLRCYAFVPEDVARGKAAQLLLLGAHVVRVRQIEEGRDPTVQMMLRTVEELGWYPSPSFGPFNPYQVEGPKTISYEVVEQLGWCSPDAILVPTGSGCLLTGVWRGIRDLNALGIVEEAPRLFPVQPTGNQPLVRAINSGKRFEEIEPEKWPRSIASGLLDPFPWDGDAAMQATRSSGGEGVAVSDEEIAEAMKLLASKEGIFAEPSGAAGLAGLKKLLDAGKIDKTETVVVLVTGSGLKEAEKTTQLYGEPPLIEPRIEELRRVLNI